MTRTKGHSSNLTFSNDDDKNLEFLLEAFGSKLSADDMASAYCEAGQDLAKASEILYNMLGSSSANDTCIPTDHVNNAPVSSVGVNVAHNQPQKAVYRPKTKNSKNSGVSVGSVSGMIGPDYGRNRASNKETREIKKPVKLMSNEFPASEIWAEKPQQKNATNETMNENVEQFLLEMLGDGFQLGMDVIKQVVGGCGYDVRESMEKLMNMSATTLDLGDLTETTDHEIKSIDSCEDLGTELEQKLQLSDSAKIDRSKLEKEVLNHLFTAPERSEVGPKKTFPIKTPRTRYGLVTGPLEDSIPQFTSPIVIKENNEDGNEKIEDNYDTLREAVKEHWIIMKKYYRAAADAYAKHNYELSEKLAQQGHFYMAKAREANETSGKMLTQTKDDGSVISIDLNEYDPKAAVRLLKSQLWSMSGISSIHYLKVIIGTNDDKPKLNARKRLIIRLLEKETITWTEQEDGQIMVIRIDVINPKLLSFNKT